MTQNRSRRNLIINTTQMAVWVGIFLIPSLVTFAMTRQTDQAMKVFLSGGEMLLPNFILYSLNYYFLVPRFLYGGRKLWFYLSNAALLLGWDVYRMFPRGPMPQEVIDQFGSQNLWALYVGGVLMAIFIQCLMILIAVGIRSVMRSNEVMVQVQEERRKTAEAELTWLKQQLNPHFLFNTLNNISSLTQIDPDKAQESIGQLSDLLRYALYDSEADTVSLASEVEFMDNYIDLMALRCNELTTVTKDLEVPSGNVQVAPLLFISLVENAFKHGVNARCPSFVTVSMHCEEGRLLFRCQNSLFEKRGSDHIGSGIGLENMKRRLELLYPNRYTYEQTSEENVYSVEVTLVL